MLLQQIPLHSQLARKHVSVIGCLKTCSPTSAGATSDLLHSTTSCLSALTHRVMASVLSRFPAAHNVASTIAEALVLELNANTMARLKVGDAEREPLFWQDMWW